MKNLMLALAVTTLSSSAFAGSMAFTCKSSDGSIIVTRDKVVGLQKDESKTDSLLIFTNQSVNTMPAVGESLELMADGAPSVKVGLLKIKSISNPKTIASSGGACPSGPGHTLGYETSAYRVRGELWIHGVKTQNVRLRCTETHTWAGTCDFGDDPEGTAESK